MKLFAYFLFLIFSLPIYALDPNNYDECKISVNYEHSNCLSPDLIEILSIDDQPLNQIEMVQLSGIGISRYEVTQSQWQTVMSNNPSFFSSCGDNCPVENVSYNDVQAFIRILNTRTLKNYRLPTEEEWIRACQAGTINLYCGSDSIEAVAWHDGNSSGSTHPVGLKQPNANNLFDMSGNVSEWTSTNWEGDNFLHVLRGGSFSSRSLAGREKHNYSYRDKTLGFRLVRDRPRPFSHLGNHL